MTARVLAPHTARPPITVGETPVRLFVTRTAVWVANYSDASITKVALHAR